MIYQDRFKGKVAVVTGGAKGIGKAIATRYVQEGGKVVVGDICTEKFADLVEELGKENIYCLKCDVSIKDDVDALVQAAYDTFGGFDVIFNNAGVNIFKDFLNCTIEDSDKIFNVNYRGVFLGSQAAAKAFVAHDTKGVIVNTSSINFRCVTPNTTCYAASKGAISMFTRGIAVELAKYGIRANCFAPEQQILTWLVNLQENVSLITQQNVWLFLVCLVQKNRLPLHVSLHLMMLLI